MAISTTITRPSETTEEVDFSSSPTKGAVAKMEIFNVLASPEVFTLLVESIVPHPRLEDVLETVQVHLLKTDGKWKKETDFIDLPKTARIFRGQIIGIKFEEDGKGILKIPSVVFCWILKTEHEKLRLLKNASEIDRWRAIVKMNAVIQMRWRKELASSKS